ncbi:hypothetical protein [Streptomonospora salina]|uniref:Uncharacterized protein n=1 Tax=Streptomonospora salina TaxID=104205 RepID=A0A841E0U9_9ACTN|nr:hypothetical protein [Streptomonospora salina]MBB5997387.1 hypothetical protein [Streptomonospora salina]
MTPGYRAIFTVPADVDAVAFAEREFRTWLRGQPWFGDHEWEVGGHYRVGDGVELSTVGHNDGERALLRLRTANTANGRVSTTTLTAARALHSRGKGGQRVWIDVGSRPDPAAGNETTWTTPAVPKLARGMLAAVDAVDGRAAVRPAPTRVAGSDPAAVDDLYAVITDPDRAVPVVVAGAIAGVAPQRWGEAVAGVLHQSAGLQAGYWLDEQAQAELDALLPDSHRVPPGTLRTFLPDVRREDPADGRRHRMLSTTAINQALEGERIDARLQWVIGNAMRAHALKRSLPKELRSADRALVRAEGALPPTSSPTAWAPPAPAPADPAEQTDPALPAGQTDPAGNGAGGHVPEPVDGPLPPGVERLFADLFGSAAVTAERVADLERLAAAGRDASSEQEKLQRQLDSAESYWIAADDDLAAARASLEETETEHAIAVDELSQARERIRWLQTQLVKHGAAEAAYSQPSEDARGQRPQSLMDVLERLRSGELRYVRFTGDDKPVQELANNEGLGAWAVTAWDVLLALDDYARCKDDGAFSGNVHTYLSNAPQGFRTVGPQTHAARESDTVGKHPRMRRARMLPVPPEISAEQRIYMDAHFRIGSYRSISPRLYYHDATAATGTVYVGYLGRHLENTQS